MGDGVITEEENVISFEAVLNEFKSSSDARYK